ncbi:MAG: hypothetical protein ABIN91_00095 [Mucilaginibacter sp.]|uniref:hypothetical protein n=1 Tax=Mucilaginibacter sp. TaxID=1882438 RepID=UPI00326411FE
MSNAIVSFEPNVDQLNEIKNWLLIEDQEKRFAGLYCNWNSIEYSLGRKEIAIILLGEMPIGFLTWFKNERAATIQFTEKGDFFLEEGRICKYAGFVGSQRK